MERKTLYRALELEKVIMSKKLFDKLEATELSELQARWIGINILLKEYNPKYKAEWIGRFFWNSTTLTVGVAEVNRQNLNRERQEQKKEKIEIQEKLALDKLRNWRQMSENEKQSLIEKNLNKHDSFYQNYVKKNYWNNLSAMSDQMILFWFWQMIPPFALSKNHLPEAKAA